MIRNPKLRYPREATLTWKATWLFGWLSHPIFFRYRIEGLHNLPKNGGCILACNHTYGLDFCLVGAAGPRQVHFMAKAELFRANPLLARYLYGLGAFPVERNKSDFGALRTAVQKVKDGNVLGMFPEGTRSKTGQLQKAKTGTARIAISAGVPVVPAAVIGSQEIFKHYWKLKPRPYITIRYGEPLIWSGSAKGEEASRQFTDQIMSAIADLLPPEMHGFYSGVPSEGV